MLELKPFQRSALEALKRPGHVLCVAPTGSGKSLIYEKAADFPGRRTLLVSPLVALARQQRARLDPRSTQVVSPEKLRSIRASGSLKRWRPDFLVVDECHCLWEWGAGFRPAFREIPSLIHELSIPRSLWLTATLPPEARADLRSSVQGLVELGEFDLPRIDLSVARVPWARRAEVLLGWIEQQREPGIVFAPTREASVRIARLAHARGLRSTVYHAGMSVEERSAIERGLEIGLPDVVVATSAFGMGMHYPGLRWVAFWQAPLSLLALAQATGRVARGEAQCGRALVLWDDDDFRSLEWTLRSSDSQARRIGEVREFLLSVTCRKAALRSYFSETLSRVDVPRCGSCDICLM